MYKLILPIYGALPKNKPLTLNWYRNADYHESNNAKKKFKKMIQSQLELLKPTTKKVSLEFLYFAKRRGTDLDNFTSVVKKYFQDALVESGYIQDDNCEYVISTQERFGEIDKLNPRLEVFIIEV